MDVQNKLQLLHHRDRGRKRRRRPLPSSLLLRQLGSVQRSTVIVTSVCGSRQQRFFFALEPGKNAYSQQVRCFDVLGEKVLGSPPRRAVSFLFPRGYLYISTIGNVLMVGLSYGAGNVLSYTRCMMHNVPAFRDIPIIPLRR